MSDESIEGLFKDSQEYTDEEVAAARVQALEDIAVAREFIETIGGGLATWNVTFPDSNLESQVASLARMIHETADQGGVLLIASVAISMLAEHGVFKPDPEGVPSFE